jgi:hypothetical protein
MQMAKENEYDRGWRIGHQNPAAQSGTACQIELPRSPTEM